MREKLLIGFCVVLWASSAFASDTHLRIVAANLSSGNHQSYDAGDGARVLKGLQPDVVLIQEFRYGTQSEEDIRKFVTETFGADFSYQRESTEGDDPGPLPNGVISRFPILEKGEWEDPIPKNRDFTWARIDIPGSHKLFAISVHLKASNDSASRKKREDESKSLVELIKANVPADDYVVVGGDFNTYSFDEAPFEILKDTVSEEAHPENPFPSSSTATNMTGRNPYDHVLVSAELQKVMVPVHFDAAPTTEFPSGLIFDSSTFAPLSLAPGVLSGDSHASGMQHLPVVKDFVIPEAQAPAGNASP